MEPPTPRRSSRSRLTSPGGLLASGVGLLVLLGLVVAASRAHHTPGGHAGVHRPPSGVGDYAFSIFAVLLVSGAFFLLYLWFSERGLLAENRRRREGKGMHKALVLLLLFGLLATLVARWGSHFRFLSSWRHRHPPALVQPGAPGTSQVQTPSGRLAERPPKFEWLPVFIATASGVTLLGFVGARTLRRTRGELAARFVLEQELESLLDDTLDDLYAQTDPRAAIIAAYARMERIFEAYGVPRRPAEAPMEYLDRALAELDATGAALGRLTGLFQWAKFSAHEVSWAQREEAITALTEVRDELRTKRAEDALRREEAQRFERERSLEGPSGI
jgi:Domain of unknown function (DUF4129)